MDDVVARALDRHARRHPGLVAGVLRDGARAVAARGHVATDSIFEIGSITKTFTALVLARMAQDGRAALDERPFRGQEVTLADLATHTSGFPRLPPRMLVHALLRERSDPYASIGEAEVADALRALRVRRRGRVRYSNFGAGVLGLLLARRAGCSYDELVRREVCDPLGLADTTAAVRAHSRERVAQGRDRRGRPVAPWTFDALTGAGALRSTAADMLAYLAFQLDPPDTALGAAARLTQEPRARRGRMRVGLAWMRLPAGGGIVFHNGGTGGFRSMACFAPDRRAAAVVLGASARSVDALGMGLLLEVAGPVRAGARTKVWRRG